MKLQKRSHTMKNILHVLLGVGIAIMILVGEKYYEVRNFKSKVVLETLYNHYYNVDALESLMKERLGENYSDDVQENFDDYVIQLILDDLNTQEQGTMRYYNKYYDKEAYPLLMEKISNEDDIYESYAIDDKTYYVHFTNFAKDKSYSFLSENIDEINKYETLVLDLRNNSGGDIGEFEKIADMFVEKDVEMYGLVSNGDETRIKSKENKRVSANQLYVLVNGKTGSVSELFLLVLSEYSSDMTIVGMPTKGKYFSFGLKKYLDGTGLTFVKGIMQGPAKKDIPKEGIRPDIYVGHDEEYYKALSEEEAAQARASDRELQFNQVLELIDE